MEKIRKQLDIIDTKIVTLLAKRQSYMPAVGKHKKANDLPILQSARERSIIQSKKKLARALKLDSILTEKIFKLIFKNSREIQKKFK